MSTQQTEALQCAADLEYSISHHGRQDAFTLNAYSAMKMVRTQQARITELESQLAQRFDAADMATAAAQGFRDGATATAQPVAESADTVVLNAAMRAIQQAIELIGAPTDERMRAVRRVLRGAVIVAEDAVTETCYRWIVNVADSIQIEALCASHGQAPAWATEPTDQQILEAAEKAGLWPNTVHSWIPAFHRYHKELAKAQADSVQEDAARYRWLRNKSQVVLDRAWFGGMPVRNHYGDFLCRDDALAALEAAIDAARAAPAQKGTNDDHK